MAKRERFMTPFGIVTGFCAIDKPSTTFNDDGVYSFQLEFAGADAEKMKRQIDVWMKRAKSQAEMKKIAPVPYEIDNVNKTLTVKFKLKAVIRSRKGDVFEKRIDCYDSQGKKLEVLPRYGAGTVLRVNCEPYMWAVPSLGAGLTLQPLAIQAKAVVEYGSDANPFDPLIGDNEDDDGIDDDDFGAIEPDDDDDAGDF